MLTTGGQASEKHPFWIQTQDAKKGQGDSRVPDWVPGRGIPQWLCPGLLHFCETLEMIDDR